ncbi:Bifunctional protein FolD protein [Legionella quinlivanii]|uniref:Bifunctional protein FolD n=1 Tax=Legionella quinlivanii TaxID=45073 RepID=A0A0W0XUK2_9GAMM|nr:bifunctional methylenetetrahydrofolate dehydrogenase/methenyltetrahydrofolate cyclohydrolase FolD [Legionella quinlivanii]KTD48217.1 Bifunctional protein FolD protein [Legionella quinlivanii]SEF98684.1 methylenetetrahydrofolate dehydrogenase (NADP+) / methenyltetrahydrofolate cyclohydrolase [Legionella quinlivanii DSM 21216]STY11335.1 methenyltetrahydrofolate cyclohydrolase [Legionella quinlivanii]
MTAQILDGKSVATQLKLSLKEEINQRKSSGKVNPGLAVILVGNDSASEIYVANKRKACAEIGINSYAYDLPADTDEKSLLQLIEELNRAENIHGILVQLPLPQHINEATIIEALSPLKDVDGFHPYNIGRLAQRSPLLRPCTPAGIIELLRSYDIPLRGTDALVIGASNIVGRPMMLEFLLAASTVTITHRFSNNLEKHVRNAEIIVVATGKTDVLDTSWLSENQIIVDVGIHRLEDGSLCGDVDYNKAVEKVAWITPVPGGVGPMTIAMLLQNTLIAARHLTGS